MVRVIHDGSPTSLSTYVAVDGSPFVHLCRADSPLALCGAPCQQHTHGSLGVLCMDCDSAATEQRLAVVLLEGRTT
jgi:hypothetical protein